MSQVLGYGLDGIYGYSYIPLTTNFYDKQNIIPTIAVFVWVMGVFGTIILLITRRRKMISVASSLYEQIPFGDRKSIIHTAIALTILALIYDTTFAMIVSLRDMKEIQKNSNQTLVLQVTLLVAKSATKLLSGNFIVKGCVVYFIFYRLLCLYISYTLETIRTHLESLRGRSTNLLVVHEILSESLEFMIEFDDMFSLLPFLWMTDNFLYTTSNVYRIVKGNNNRHDNDQCCSISFQSGMLFFIGIAVDNLAVILLVLYMSRQKQKRERDKRIIQNLLVKQINPDSLHKVMHQLIS